MDPVRDVYAARCESRKAEVERLDRRILLVSNLRLATFVLAMAVAYLALGARAIALWWLLAPIVTFLLLAVIHDRLHREREDASRALTFYQAGLGRLDHTWQGKGVTRQDLVPEDHLFARDLDLFGKGSLFELLCTAWTAAGEAILARWLTELAPVGEIKKRQEAVAKLCPRLDFREQLAVLTGPVRSTLHPDHLCRWGQAPPHFSRRALVAWYAAAWIMTAGAVAALVAWIATDLGPLLLEFAILGELLLTLRSRKTFETIISSVSLPNRELAVLARLLARLEREPPGGRKLRELQQALTAGGQPASRRIERLVGLVRWLEMQRNLFFAPMAFLLMWHLHFGLAIERWRVRYGPAIGGWLDAVGEIEALNALAGYAYEHPQDPFPTLVEGEATFDGEGLGHPLLPDDVCVRNSVSLGPSSRLLVVSGSNMSGKSTLLRVVGINVVLAMAGAPVRARRLALSSLALGSTICVQDSLAGGTSRFFTEIRRMKRMMEAARGESRLLFLLDELLHGTNSHDRKLGAEAVVRGYLALGAIGLVTTHDLALADVAERLAPMARNVHFDDRLEGGTLVFDYVLKPGVVTKSNALDLMRAVGLTVDSTPAAPPREPERDQ